MVEHTHKHCHNLLHFTECNSHFDCILYFCIVCSYASTHKHINQFEIQTGGGWQAKKKYVKANIFQRPKIRKRTKIGIESCSLKTENSMRIKIELYETATSIQSTKWRSERPLNHRTTNQAVIQPAQQPLIVNAINMSVELPLFFFCKIICWFRYFFYFLHILYYLEHLHIL